MNRFCGEIGYGNSVETPSGSGVYRDTITERVYRGDVLRNTRRLEETDKINPDVVVGNSISIVADAHAIENFMDIRYIKWEGKLWTVTSVEVRSPRLILSLGSIYNGPTPPTL